MKQRASGFLKDIAVLGFATCGVFNGLMACIPKKNKDKPQGPAKSLRVHHAVSARRSKHLQRRGTFDPQKHLNRFLTGSLEQLESKTHPSILKIKLKTPLSRPPFRRLPENTKPFLPNNNPTAKPVRNPRRPLMEMQSSQQLTGLPSHCLRRSAVGRLRLLGEVDSVNGLRISQIVARDWYELVSYDI